MWTIFLPIYWVHYGVFFFLPHFPFLLPAGPPTSIVLNAGLLPRPLHEDDFFTIFFPFWTLSEFWPHRDGFVRPTISLLPLTPSFFHFFLVHDFPSSFSPHPDFDDPFPSAASYILDVISVKHRFGRAGLPFSPFFLPHSYEVLFPPDPGTKHFLLFDLARTYCGIWSPLR